ncbi:hypothetical protein [Amycolatopsis sp. PS_44_ISF1]|uniref:hypothetical protein n=1 Tax=Amycolatopsis sp. PS_44_ISF1 TaxID=2974917 RepID=UPI0028DE493C|nr:hypothetical protein [Amycolatopsis sp. PS_44_ISF1]MDT8913571.1 hypothetical protein [Amycolatopsis sp. PS_44_ISF1]
MRTAGLTMNDVWSGRVLRERGVTTHRCEGLPAEIGVFVEAAELKHWDRNENYRPYLHITGQLRWLAPQTALPYGISRVIYAPEQGERVDAFYEFDDRQLQTLAAKGYFHSAFAVPEQRFTGIEWELPAVMDALVLAPPATGAGLPVVFTRVHNIAGLEIDLASSGYDLTDYIDDTPQGGLSRITPVSSEQELRARTDVVDPLFPEEPLDLPGQPERPDPPAGDTPPEADPVSTRLQQVEADIAAEHERYRGEREGTRGTPEHLYHTHVAQPLRAAGDHVGRPRPGYSPATPPDADLRHEQREAQPEQRMHPSAPHARRDEAAPYTAGADTHLGEDERGLGS